MKHNLNILRTNIKMGMVYEQNHKNWTKQKYYRDHFVTKTFTVVRVELDSDSLSQFFTNKVFWQILVIDNIGGCLASMSVTENHVLFFYQSSFPTNISHWLNMLIPSINVTVTENHVILLRLQVESNGTVLSTNWKEVGTKKVEGSPPDGMELKKWEY